MKKPKTYLAGKLVKKARQKKKMTQVQASRSVRLATSFWANIERGAQPVPKRRVSRICKALGIKRSMMVSAMLKDFERQLI